MVTALHGGGGLPRHPVAGMRAIGRQSGDRREACDPRHTAPPPPRRMLARWRAALALTGRDGRAIVPPRHLAPSRWIHRLWQQDGAVRGSWDG